LYSTKQLRSELTFSSVVFVHGPNEDANTAWAFAESGTFWPLSISTNHGQGAQFWSFNYDTCSATFEDESALRTQSELLADALVKIVNDRYSGATVILVTRGLGSLVAQYACVMADTRTGIDDIHWDMIAFEEPSSGENLSPVGSEPTEETDDQLAVSKMRQEIDAQFKVLLEQPYSTRHTSYYPIPMKSEPNTDERQEVSHGEMSWNGI
jgi:hypothetical protein